MENVTKRFGKVVANNAINLELHEGEILSLLGENGSGKTTLMNMLSGIYFPDEGQIYIHGEPVTIASPKDAFEHGIGMIHQHFKLVDLFTATENIILGLEGKLDIAEASKKVKEICDKYGFDIDPNQKIYDMSVSQKQTVEIVKVLYRGADILILDEPTAVLTPQETDKLFAIMRNMKADGKSLIIITHKLNEVMEISDVVAVLRKGQHIATVKTAETDESKLTEMMVGRKVSLNIDRPEPVNPQPRLTIAGLTCRDSEGVTKLGAFAFNNAGSAYYTGLTSITLPDSLQEVGRRALYGCKALSSIEVSAANPCLTVQDGILYNKAMTQLIRCPAAGGLTAYTVPASVTELAEGAFASCTSLESIVLPEGMTSIADNAFEGCSALREVTLPSTLKTLNYACFGWCSSLTNIVLPEGTEKLDWSVFASCTSLSSVTIPSSVKTIDVYAFNKCPLKEVKISKDCVLGSQAFGKDVKIKYYH